MNSFGKHQRYPSLAKGRLSLAAKVSYSFSWNLAAAEFLCDAKSSGLRFVVCYRRHVHWVNLGGWF